MKNRERFYIELLITTINSSGFIFRSIPKAVFTSFLKLNDEYKGEKKKLKQKYNRSSRTYFNENISVSERKDKLERKIESFWRRVESISPISSFEFYPNDALEKEYKELYKYYCSITGLKRGRPLKINNYGEGDIFSTKKKVDQIARDCLEIELLSEIRDELEFSEIYTSADLKRVKGVADACWDLYESNNDITSTKLIQRVLSEYHITYYDGESSEETKRKTKKAVKQWIRDVKEHNGIEISN